eukprot:COSAG06_NODE_71159_length_187_cov_29.500000_1_plen_62_part_11
MHVWVSKNGLIDPFMHTNEHFTKTGSGQTYRENSKTEWRFLRKLRERTRQLLLRELWKVRKQ